MKARRSPFAMIPLWVYDDRLTTPTVLAVYTALAAIAYDRSARRSVADLMDRSGLSRSTVYAALTTLEQMGAIVPDGHSVWFLPVDLESTVAECPIAESTVADEKSAQPDRKSTVAESLLILSREGSRGSIESDARSFDAFWVAYPLKLDKGSARRAWSTATRKATPEQIIAGAVRYASDPNRDPGFTKRPATWLNAESWDNPPLPSRLPAPAEPKGWQGIRSSRDRQRPSALLELGENT